MPVRVVGLPIKERLHRFTMYEPNTGCHFFTGCIDRDGYGKIRVDGVSKYAHRVAYETFVGPVHPQLKIDHLCRNRRCINERHLEAVTHRENCLRGIAPTIIAAKKNECMRGHALTEENVYTIKSRPGYRFCRICVLERSRRYATRKQAS